MLAASKAEAMTKIYFDESGNTGTELLDLQQPYFCIGSTDIQELEAADIIGRCFPNLQADELKSKNVLRRGRGQKAFVSFAREVGARPERFVASKINKRFTVLCKMVDCLTEPMLRNAGYDFYEGDYAARYANMAYSAFQAFLDEAASDRLYDSFNAFARAPSDPLLEALKRTLREVKAQAGRALASSLSC